MNWNLQKYQRVRKCSLDDYFYSKSPNIKNTNAQQQEYVRGTQEPIRRVPKWPKLGNLSNKINDVALDYNLKYKINT